MEAKKERPKTAKPNSKQTINKEEVKKSSDDVSMHDESTLKKFEKKGMFGDKMKEPAHDSKFKVFNSKEHGFTGDKEAWFDEDLYNKPKQKANFDDAKKHDYYYNSYSSHHIHEEMLKD